MLQCLALLGETGCQRVHEVVVALCIGESLAADGDLVEAVGIESMPGEFHQSQMGEDLVQVLAFAQSADIVQTGVEGKSLARIALDATACLLLAFQHEYPLAGLCQQVGADESAESASDDHHVVSHACLRLSHR